MKKGAQKMYATLAGAFIVGGIVGGIAVYQPNESATELPMTWGMYTSSSEAYTVGVPAGSEVSHMAVSNTNGRLGGAVIQEGAGKDDPSVSVSTYSSRENLEKDFRDSRAATFEEGMALNGLTKMATTISGNPANIYSGVHAVDGVGGAEYDYIGIEIIGPTYAYMIQFYHMGTNPNDERVQEYLNSFEAK